MILELDKIKENYLSVVDILLKISNERNNKNLFEKCQLIKNYVSTLNDKQESKEIKSLLYNLLDEIKYVVQAEIRFFLFPLPEIKEQTFQIGKNYMDNFLEWFNPENKMTVEMILEFLEEEIYLIDESKIILDKIEI